MADNNTIARPYARAVFELANDAGELTRWSESLDVAIQLLADGQVVEYLSNPAFSDDRRLQFLASLFAQAGGKVFAGEDKHGTNFLKLLLEYGRIAVLPEVAAHFETFKAQVENIVDVTITSAAPLSKEQQDKISTSLRSRLGRDVKLETAIDENLIGGALIKAGDVVIDGSLRARLEGLSSALIK